MSGMFVELVEVSMNSSKSTSLKLEVLLIRVAGTDCDLTDVEITDVFPVVVLTVGNKSGGREDDKFVASGVRALFWDNLERMLFETG